MEAVDNKNLNGNAYTLNDDKGTKQLLIRDKKGTYILSSYLDDLTKGIKIYEKASFLLQTKNMSLIITGSEKHITVWCAQTKSIIFQSSFNYIYSISLSQNERYLQILDKVDANQGKTIIYSLPKIEKVKEFKENAMSNYYLKQSYPLVRFNKDDGKAFRYNSKVIEVYGTGVQGKQGEWVLEKQLISGPVEMLEISKISQGENFMVVCVYLDKKTNSGMLTLFNQQSNNTPFYEKNIKKAEEIKLRFSPTSNKFLMELQTYYDPTGKSYYGQYGLYIFNDQTKKINKVNTFKGPVHDFCWDLLGKFFIVISGFMPSHSVMFDQNNKEVFQFGEHHRNKIYFGNLGRFLCLAGFGNLSGEMQMWDLKEKKKMGQCKSNSASYCQWSPDDRKLITSIITPRLRVDNCFKIFSYTGVLLNKAGYDDTQLYEAVFSKTNQYEGKEVRGISPNRKIGIEEKKEDTKFKSFGAAFGLGTTTINTYNNTLNSHLMNKDNGPTLVPGQHVDDAPKKKKRVRNRKQLNLEAEI